MMELKAHELSGYAVSSNVLLQDAGFEQVVDFGPDRTTKYLAQEQVRWVPILRESGLKPG